MPSGHPESVGRLQILASQASEIVSSVSAVLAVLIILLLEVTTGQGVLTRWLTL